jgi:DNA-binding beta-propeller fold protein YncE
VAVSDGLVALAIEANPKTSPGVVAFYNAADLRLLHSVTVGALPDMVVFTPDGKYLLVANEGEPNSYGQPASVDPEGSVSVITINRTGTSTVATADFRAFNGQETALRAQGIRLVGPGASPSVPIAKQPMSHFKKTMRLRLSISPARASHRSNRWGQKTTT